LFSILDEECLFPKGTDQTFMEKMQRTFGGNPIFKAVSGRSQEGTFTVEHYAGTVSYNVGGFLYKNRDTLFDDLKELCLSSQMQTLREVFERAQAREPQINTKGGKARPVTAGYQFRQSVAELLKALYACQPHYIRTIKPNDDKRPLTFDDTRVTEQARYLGLLENLKVRRAGFCYRTTYDRWVRRYGVVSDKTFPQWNGDPRAGVEVILGEVGIGSKDYAFGKTKIFIRDPQTLYTMEDSRLKALDKIAAKVKTAKCPPKKIEGNVCLEYLRILVFQELDEFVIIRPPKKNENMNTVYKAYQNVESDYVAGMITPDELRNSLYQLLVDVSEPIRDHFQKEKKSFWSFLKFWNSGKSTTSGLGSP